MVVVNSLSRMIISRALYLQLGRVRRATASSIQANKEFFFFFNVHMFTVNSQRFK